MTSYPFCNGIHAYWCRDQTSTSLTSLQADGGWNYWVNFRMEQTGRELDWEWVELDYQPLFKLGSWTWAHWGEYNDWGKGIKQKFTLFSILQNQLTGGGVWCDVLRKMERHLGLGVEDPLGMEKAWSSERVQGSISSACRGGWERERMDGWSASWS